MLDNELAALEHVLDSAGACIEDPANRRDQEMTGRRASSWQSMGGAMSGRSRHVTSFKPHTDHLEDAAPGASVITPGMPSTDADNLQPADHGPSSTSLNQAALPATEGTAYASDSRSQPTEDLEAGIKAPVDSETAGASVSAPPAIAGIIRPLTLTPRAQPESAPLAGILSQASDVDPVIKSARPAQPAVATGRAMSQGGSAGRLP